MKLKLSTGSNANSQAGSPPATPAPPTPSVSGGGFKLKIRTSAPPTPATENAPLVEPLGPPPPKQKRPYNKKAKDGDLKASGKRAADGDISPAPKRPAVDEGKRRISFKVSSGDTYDSIDVATPASAGPKIKFAAPKRRSSGPKNITLTAKRRPPPRPVGVGYDSEASDAETDPAIEQQFVLRMPDPSTFDDAAVRSRVRDDAAYLHKAIEEKRIGPLSEGGADVSFRFVTRDLRRAVVTVRGNKYTAVMVDLPCVVESLKSWDRRGGWWKVADIAQLLLVLGPVPPGQEADDAAKRAVLPRDIDRDMRYAHGLTPPMHYVRKRRFRKRVSHRDIEDVEEQVERLLRDDRECESRGGEVNFKVFDGTVLPSQLGGDDADADGEFVETTEDPYGRRMSTGPDEDADDFDEAELLAGLENMDDEDEDADADGAATARSSSLAAASSSATPAPPPPASSSSSDDDDDDASDDDQMGAGPAPDEDEVAEANERQAQREEIADLEREVRHKRDEMNRHTNQLLKQRVRQNLRALEEELDMKRKAFGIGEDDDEDGDEDSEA